MFFKIDYRRFCCCFYVSLIFFCQKQRRRLHTLKCSVVDRYPKVDCFFLSFASILALTVWLMLFFVFQGWLLKVLLLFLCFLNLFLSKTTSKTNVLTVKGWLFFCVFPLPASLRVDHLIVVVFCFSRLIVEGFVVVFMFP